ncbi:hypothetical protein EAG_01281, partial [Camponotus floridanus]
THAFIHTQLYQRIHSVKQTAFIPAHLTNCIYTRAFIRPHLYIRIYSSTFVHA